MCPYSGKALINDQRKIFNYRLSRARRIIENTFGILVSRWRVFQTPINATPEKVEKIIIATVALHNYLRQTDNDSGEITEGQCGVLRLTEIISNRLTEFEIAVTRIPPYKHGKNFQSFR